MVMAAAGPMRSSLRLGWRIQVCTPHTDPKPTQRKTKTDWKKNRVGERHLSVQQCADFVIKPIMILDKSHLPFTESKSNRMDPSGWLQARENAVLGSVCGFCYTPKGQRGTRCRPVSNQTPWLINSS
ncbi:hypothetical protein GOODEAATRI_031032 [Goodea atripinnis]|uniref:Uncharacterized protein n=1 Tax=Goodea atripinnis TaxID=208336 RepID=A0ABV0NPJ9_9TELE